MRMEPVEEDDVGRDCEYTYILCGGSGVREIEQMRARNHSTILFAIEVKINISSRA